MKGKATSSVSLELLSGNWIQMTGNSRISQHVLHAVVWIIVSLLGRRRDRVGGSGNSLYGEKLGEVAIATLKPEGLGSAGG